MREGDFVPAVASKLARTVHASRAVFIPTRRHLGLVPGRGLCGLWMRLVRPGAEVNCPPCLRVLARNGWSVRGPDD